MAGIGQMATGCEFGVGREGDAHCFGNDLHRGLLQRETCSLWQSDFRPHRDEQSCRRASSDQLHGRWFHLHRDDQRDADSDADAYSDPDPDADAHANADPDADAYADSHVDADADAHADAHADSYADPDPDADADALR